MSSKRAIGVFRDAKVGPPVILDIIRCAADRIPIEHKPLACDCLTFFVLLFVHSMLLVANLFFGQEKRRSITCRLTDDRMGDLHKFIIRLSVHTMAI